MNPHNFTCECPGRPLAHYHDCPIVVAQVLKQQLDAERLEVYKHNKREKARLHEAMRSLEYAYIMLEEVYGEIDMESASQCHDHDQLQKMVRLIKEYKEQA